MESCIRVRGYRICCAFAFVSVLAACGQDGSSQVSQASSPASLYPGAQSAAPIPQTPLVSGAAEYAPQIFGVPATTAVVGRSYSFQPSASAQGNNNVLSFAISGAPSWVTFNSKTGLLTGTPTSADVGVDSAIVVQLSDGNATVYLAPFTITVVSASQPGTSGAGAGTNGNVSLSWVAPSENTDGTPLTDLSGYVIHYGSAPMSFTNSITITNPGLTRYVVENLPAGTYYFSVTAITSSGSQSGYSAEASTTIS
jgi:hypothetical protein